MSMSVSQYLIVSVLVSQIHSVNVTVSKLSQYLTVSVSVSVSQIHSVNVKVSQCQCLIFTVSVSQCLSVTLWYQERDQEQREYQEKKSAQT
ncbi:uncharacterized [Tachysurus ichikawai]